MGVYLNDTLVNKKVTINSLNLKNGLKTILKIGVKPDAKNCGGMNLFGEKFGDYNHSIIFSAKYK